MIERRITRDISKYEAKLIGPFTTRQIVLGIPGLGLGVATYFMLADKLDKTALLVGMLVALPFLIFAYFKPYGMKLEQFLKTAFVSLVLSPATRKYKTENTFQEYIKPRVSEHRNKTKKYKSKNDECKAI